MQKRKAFPCSEKGGRAVTYRLPMPTSHSLQFEEKVAYMVILIVLPLLQDIHKHTDDHYHYQYLLPGRINPPIIPA